jgi:hypothetical protein
MAAEISAEALERRRRLTLRWVLICAAIPLVGWPLALLISDGSENRDAVAGALLLAGLFALGAVPFVLGSWRSFMARTLLDALVAEQRGMRHIDGEERHEQAAAALASPAFDLGAFDGVGLVEPFRAARVAHVLDGEAEGIPFALAELRLFNQEGFQVFAGVLGSFRLRRPCPGLTLVTRERGLVGNLVASAGTGIERVTLEDPAFERRFEVYGSDQVWCRTVLTATMLERLLRLDEITHARGFRCAFVGDHLLVALSGARWRCGLWRILFPLESWLAGYRDRLAATIATPSAMVRELALNAQAPAVGTVPVIRPRGAWNTTDDSNTVMAGRLPRLVAGIGMPVIYIASGTLFGGISLFFGRLVFLEWGVDASGGWKMAWPIPLGALYGMFAIGFGVKEFMRLAWIWNAPLRSVRRLPGR